MARDSSEPSTPSVSSSSRKGCSSRQVDKYSCLQPASLTHDGSLGRVDGAPLRLSVQPAGHSAYPGFDIFVLPQTSARVLKAHVRTRCRALVGVADDRIRLLYRGVELRNDQPISQHVPIYDGEPTSQAVEIHFMVLKAEEFPAQVEPSLCLSAGVPCPTALADVLEECNAGLSDGQEPMLTTGGTGGAYVLRRESGREALAVFKPKDEEAGGPQNPRGYAGAENTRGSKPGVRSAHRAVREVAAYLLDDGFAGVPMTTLAHGRHRSFAPLRDEGDIVWKVGSFQAFVPTCESSDNFGRQVYAKQNVHRIGILDIRIANFDRNYGNMLVKTGRDQDDSRTLTLVPIDHGCSLPDRLQICCGDLVWMAWPQSKQPFGQEELGYIAALDGVADAQRLSDSLGLERDGLRLLEVTTRWLQVAAAREWTLFEIGLALCRSDENPDALSKIEHVIVSSIAAARAALKSQSSSDAIGGSRREDRHIAAALLADVPPSPSNLTRACTEDISFVELYADAAACHIGTDSGIFELPRCGSGSDSEWTPLLEAHFQRIVSAELVRLARHRAPQEAAPAPPPEEVVVLPLRSATAWVPPHVRRRLEAERVAAASGQAMAENEPAP